MAAVFQTASDSTMTWRNALHCLWRSWIVIWCAVVISATWTFLLVVFIPRIFLRGVNVHRVTFSVLQAYWLAHYFFRRNPLCYGNVLFDTYVIYPAKIFELCKSRSKGKAVLLQAWSGPEGSRKLRFPDYMTTAQDDGNVVSFTHRPPLPPGNAHKSRSAYLNPLSTELNPICHLLALLGAHLILHVSRIKVKFHFHFLPW
jgi:hypothetical protein